MTERIGEKLALENKLRQALEKEEFVLHYQPKVDTATRRIDSVEALIRWQSPELGLVPPMQFIPLLEETGLILEVGAWALGRAVVDHRTWTEQGLAAPRISVNVSAVQLRQRDFVATVEEAIMAGAIRRHRPRDHREPHHGRHRGDMKRLEAVRVLGVSIAIDDFGTGYSSLGYLAKAPGTLAQDRPLVHHHDAERSGDHDARLDHRLNGPLAAAQGRRRGRRCRGTGQSIGPAGCDQLQGYLFSKPVPFDDMTALLGSKPLK